MKALTVAAYTLAFLWAYSLDGIVWVSITSPKASSSWKAIAYGNGRFVAVIENTDISAYSVDGINWTQTTLPVSSAWSSITYGSGRFVMVETNITSIYSFDGINWISSAIPSGTGKCVSYGAGKFVAVSNGVASSSFVDSNVIQLPNIQNTLVRLK